MEKTSDSVDLRGISRKEFLKLSGISLLSLFLLPFKDLFNTTSHSYFAEPVLPEGRILGESVNIYDQPSFTGKLLKVVWRDLVLPITGITIGDNTPEYNRVWYKINNEGYVHSGNVQPVEVRLNPLMKEIPAGGQLAQVTVPYTDTLWSIQRPDYYAYRLYYSTTYWILAVVQDDKGNHWYRVWDDKWKIYYYADARHLKPLMQEELKTISPEIPNEAKRLEVKLKEQVVIAYENDMPVYMTRVATGAKFSDGDFRTLPGRYITNRKRPSRHMAAGDRAAPNSYDLPGVPWVCYLTKSGVSFHGTYWHNDFGRPRSHGCINCSPSASRWIYRWTLPNVPISEETWSEKDGTIVDII